MSVDLKLSMGMFESLGIWSSRPKRQSGSQICGRGGASQLSSMWIVVNKYPSMGNCGPIMFILCKWRIYSKPAASITQVHEPKA